MPLVNKFIYVLASTGKKMNEYYNEDIEQFIAFNEYGLYDNKLTFFVDNVGYEYITINLENNTEVSQGEIESIQPLLSQQLNQYFLSIHQSGRISAYSADIKDGHMESKWDEDFNKPILNTGVFDENLYLLDSKENKIMSVNSISGSIAKIMPLLWDVKKIEMKNKFIIVQSERKLYVITL